MKILTNIQSVQIGGISQFTASFNKFLEVKNKNNVELIGIDILRVYDKKDSLLDYRIKKDRLTVITQEVSCRNIKELLPTINSLTDIENEYKQIIEIFTKYIKSEKPDLIVLNGTYFIPWCLYLAAKNFNIPVILHYHGILTKETETWDVHSRLLMKKLEQTFDNSRLFYVFPSMIAKTTVENEVFGHKIGQSAILPNPIPLHFFDVSTRGKLKNVGIVGRWTEVKNTGHIKKISRYNQNNGNVLNMHLVTDLAGNKSREKTLSKLFNLYTPMDGKSLGKFYGKMGVVICPSFFETYGNVSQEALASGTPALISPNMGVSETYKKLGLEDWIIDFKSVTKTYEKIREVSKLQVGLEVRKTMQVELSPNNIGEKFLQILKQF